jgi:hypothetical protein
VPDKQVLYHLQGRQKSTFKEKKMSNKLNNKQLRMTNLGHVMLQISAKAFEVQKHINTVETKQPHDEHAYTLGIGGGNSFVDHLTGEVRYAL